MAFDDSYEDWLPAFGCLAVLSGLLAPVMILVFGWWGGVLTLVPLLCLCVAFTIFGRR